MQAARNPRTLKRIATELEKLQKEPLPFCKVELKDKAELLVWKISVTGPAGSPYEGGVFLVEADLRAEYPFKQPEVKFETKIYHPNVNRTDGSVCPDLICPNWSPQTQMKDVLERLNKVLAEPSADHPVDHEITTQFKENNKEYVKSAKDWTKKYAQKK